MKRALKQWEPHDDFCKELFLGQINRIAEHSRILQLSMPHYLNFKEDVFFKTITQTIVGTNNPLNLKIETY